MLEEMIRLWTTEDEDAIHFRKFIRLYNNIFAFNSLGGDCSGKSQKGIYVFQLQGQLYHYALDLMLRLAILQSIYSCIFMMHKMNFRIEQEQ